MSHSWSARHGWAMSIAAMFMLVGGCAQLSQHAEAPASDQYARLLIGQDRALFEKDDASVGQGHNESPAHCVIWLNNDPIFIYDGGAVIRDVSCRLAFGTNMVRCSIGSDQPVFIKVAQPTGGAFRVLGKMEFSSSTWMPLSFDTKKGAKTVPWTRDAASLDGPKAKVEIDQQLTELIGHLANEEWDKAAAQYAQAWNPDRGNNQNDAKDLKAAAKSSADLFGNGVPVLAKYELEYGEDFILVHAESSSDGLKRPLISCTNGDATHEIEQLIFAKIKGHWAIWH